MTGSGLRMLLAQFENAGPVERIQSSIGYSNNLPVTPEEISTVLTPVHLVAGGVGISKEVFVQYLSETLLPYVACPQ
jgi:uncharacterized protein YidB (DUF937 family)